ncbi:prolyl oligopeptidase family serine peptidase [Paenibacillus sp. HB172176]|uniref:alpha/beta hydrolase family protein n=1 Tax=Paenibacillus sp. HB172176 TaxID=2493690 RepID=UPI00143CA3DC|nr:prolyl oligopeptidase family serine peptidase [Paenibacillus sp. HB172176]
MNSRIQELEQYICTLYDTRDQLKRHIFNRADQAFAKGDHERDLVTNLDQLKARQAEMKRAFLTSIGGLPLSDTPLHARKTGGSKRPGYSVENIIFESRPGHYVTSNLYLPEGRDEQCAAVLFVCGHEYEGKSSLYYEQVCLKLVQSGLIVMAIDPIGQGERLGFHESAAIANASNATEVIWGTREHQFIGAQCYALGDSVARYFIHDAMRAIDYLCEREEVDPNRIGITGNSGGGTQTAMMMVCDERIAAAAPATFIMNRQQYMHAGGVQDAEQVWPGLTAAGFDHEDLLLLFAPKPLLVLSVQYDFFPIEATRRTLERTRRFWEMHGKQKNLLMAEDKSLHRYTDLLAQAAADFFREFLLGEAPLIDQEPLQPIPADELLCTPTGQVLRDLPDARTIRDDNAKRCGELERARDSAPVEQRQERMAEWLRATVFKHRNPCELNARRVNMGLVEGLQVEYLLWWSQSDMMNSGYLIRSADATAAGMKQSIMIGVWLGGTTRLAEHWTWIRETCREGRSVLVFNSSGSGPHEPYPIYNKPVHRFFGVIHKLTDELLWLGDSLAAMRTYDITRCLDVISQLDEGYSGEIDFYTAGNQGLYVRLAAVLDQRVGRIDSEQSLGSYSQWASSSSYHEEDVMSIVMPELLKYMDPSCEKGWFEIG